MLLRIVGKALWVVVVCAATARALVVVERDFRDLVERAEVILEGTVSGVEEVPDATGIQRTLVALTDLEVHKGTVSGPKFALDVVGGTKNGFRSQVLDLPSFTLGDRVILFVRGNGQAVFPVVGVHQGYFRVERLEDGSSRIVRCDGLPVVAREQRALRFAPRTSRGMERAVSLEEFRTWIRNEMQTLGGGVGR
ncbi:hypothetical protein HRbin30_01337 [bacterium HR30]|nr:hypothetical protein HRbin30_01337 [bacterium HR30]